MHMITVHPNHVMCSCGYYQTTRTGAEAQRLAYIHARANMPANVVDHRHLEQGDI